MSTANRSPRLLTATVMFGLVGMLWLYVAVQGRRINAEQSLLNASLQQTRFEKAKRSDELRVAQESLKAAERHLLDLAVQNRDAENKLFALQPELRWAMPPARLPDWNPESPYVWFNKDALGRIQLHPLELTGSLTTDVCAVLEIQPEEKQAIEAAAKGMFGQYEQQTINLAMPTPQPPKGREIEPNQRFITVKIPPMDAYISELRSEFSTVVRDTLGPQRAGLFLQWSEGLIYSLINQDVAESKFVSLIQETNGYSLIVTTPHSYRTAPAASLDSLMQGYPSYLVPHKLVQHLGDLLKSAPGLTPQN